MEHKFKVVLGDWSNDGHGQCKEIIYGANYPVDKLQGAYRSSCIKLGFQFHHSYDGKQIPVATEYGDSEIKLEVVEILFKHNCTLLKDWGINENDMEEITETGEGLYLTKKEFADLIMWFIAQSMPADFAYQSMEDEVPALNGWWGSLNHTFGYGLFD